ncbi:hypothetical protein DH2020_021469 [Rehmannia glutinosa]|uniref:Protein ROS1 n=1 Tax=Rehmannia glutinosa TaxID=99300 RepID=A0ABR0WEZ8_REHGL
MNLGRGISVPHEKGGVWIPATPEKPLIINNGPVGMQQNQIENWQDLIGIYTGVLQDELPPEFNPNSNVGLNCRENTVRDLAYVDNCNRSHNQTGLTGLNHGEHNIQDVDKFRNFNRNARIIGPYLQMQNLGNVVPAQKVNSLAELMGMTNGLKNGDRNTCVVDKRTSIGSQSRVERNWKTYEPDSTILLQNQILHTNQDDGGYIPQRIPNSRLSVHYRPSYNLNLPPMLEAGECSRAARPSQLGPVTPDREKQLLKSNKTIQVPNLLTDEITTQETKKQNNIILPHQPEILEREREYFLHDTPGTSSAAISTTVEGKQYSDGEIDLKKTPPQKTPKRRKHRPKVVVEGKPKRTPKPASTKDNSPDGNPTTKRKYVRKKGVETSTNQSTDAAKVEESNVNPKAKSCKRALHFDLEHGVEKKTKGSEFDYQAKNDERSKTSFDLNLDSRNPERFIESKGQPSSAVTEVHQNVYEKQMENLYNFLRSVKKIPPQATSQQTSKNHTLNVIARNLNMRNANVNYNKVEDKINRTAAEDSSKQIESIGNKSFRAWSFGLQLNGGLPNFVSEGKSASVNPTNETNKVTSHLCVEKPARVTSHHLAKAQPTSSHTAVANCHQSSASQRDPKVTQGNEIIDSPARALVKRQTARQTSSDKMSSMQNIFQRTHNLNVKLNLLHRKLNPFLYFSAGSQKDMRTIFSIDDITDRMQNLLLDNKGKKIVAEEHSALVPYREGGAVVPYEAIDPIKKRRPRPKVELDPETNRLWNLLMGKEGSESEDTINNDKQKWWEEERKVFRGRVDSFIARMHLVQGDRRFSKWKGSVVDSVIGVFLTQNVSDHLSSSAFMSLAAKFPIKSTTIRRTCCQNGENPSFEHEVFVTYPDGTTSYDHTTKKEPVSDHSSVKSSEFSDHGAENLNLGTTNFINSHTIRTEEGMISPQSSSESIIFHASDDIRSGSESNSEAKDWITGSNFRKNHGLLSFSGRSFPGTRPSIGQQQENLVYKQNPKVTSSRNVNSYPLATNVLHYQRPVPPSSSPGQKMPTGLEKWEADYLAFLGGESTSSFASIVSGITNGTCLEHAHDNPNQSENIRLEPTGTKKLHSSDVPPSKIDTTSNSKSGRLRRKRRNHLIGIP